MFDFLWRREMMAPKYKDSLLRSISSSGGITERTTDPTNSVDDFSNLSLHDGCHAMGQRPKSCLAVKTQRESMNGVGSVRSKRSDSPASVRFDTVEFRAYEIVLSDNPSTSCGPPIGLGWAYDPRDTVTSDVDSHEAARDRWGPAYAPRAVSIPAGARTGMLLEAGYTREEVKSAARRTRKARGRTAASLRRRERIDAIRAMLARARGGLAGGGKGPRDLRGARRVDSLGLAHPDVTFGDNGVISPLSPSHKAKP